MSTRLAVSAIIQKDKKFMLVHKVKMNTIGGDKEIVQGVWGLVQGGIEPQDKDEYEAMRRELLEETGSNKYEILKKYEQKIIVRFSPEKAARIGYTDQIITMFLVRFYGDESKLSALDDEIDEVRLFEQDEMLQRITYEEVKSFFKSNLL